mgnify:CR=1 FL=1
MYWCDNGGPFHHCPFADHPKSPNEVPGALVAVVNKELDDEFGAANHRGGADFPCYYEGNAHGRECGCYPPGECFGERADPRVELFKSVTSDIKHPLKAR